MDIGILHGPNLNLIGKRETDIYGEQSFEDCLMELKKRFPSYQLDYFQSNHEGEIIDTLYAWTGQKAGILLNAGGYTHSSVALRDAIAAASIPVVEIHISDIYAREDFRKKNLIADVCAIRIIGRGLEGYEEGLKWLVAYGKL